MPLGTIKQHRQWKSATQEEVARAIGCSVNSISLYERGLRDIKFSTLLRFADWADCAVSDIKVLLTEKQDRQ